MAQKPDTRLTVRLDETVLEALEALSKKRRVSMSELVRGYVERGLTRDEQPEHYRELEQLLERVIDRTVVARIERHISLTVKGIIASAAGYFLTARVIEGMVPPECQEDYRDALAEARRRGIEYVKLNAREMEEKLSEGWMLGNSEPPFQ